MAYFRFTGTSSGKVSPNRFHSSLFLSSEEYNLLIDCGDGTSRSLLKQNISFESVDGIIFTHFHPDHFSGFPALIVQMKLSGRKAPLDIFIHKELKDTALRFLHQSYLFEEKFGFDFNIRAFEERREVNIHNEFSFIARRNSHLDIYKMYDKTGEIKFISLSFLFTIDKKNLYYSGDIGSYADLKLFENEKFEIAICETTHISDEELQLLLRNPDLKSLYLTHIDENKVENLQKTCEKLTGEAKRCILAFDGLSAYL